MIRSPFHSLLAVSAVLAAAPVACAAEVENLAGSLTVSEAQSAMRERLFGHLKGTKDPRVVGGRVAWDYYPYYGKISTKGWTVDERAE